MTLVPLALRDPAALRDALVRRGVDQGRADAAAHGLAPQALLFERLDPSVRDALMGAARRVGVEGFSGDDWVLLAGGTSRLASLTRPEVAALPAPMTEALGRYLRAATETPRQWLTHRGAIALDRPVLVGVLNVTPDSFSDGGRFLDPGAALAQAEALVAAGADVIDVGAESTRPGRPRPVPEQEEWRRLAPVLTGLAARLPRVPVSVDTVKAATARRALDTGAWAINDVSGLRLDPALADVCAAWGAGLVLMHSRGTVEDMATYDHAGYRDVTTEVVAELMMSTAAAEERGVARDGVVIDPGFGFAKRPEHNYRLLRELPALVALGYPVMVGPSRKRFLSYVTGRIGERDQATAVACVAGYLLGASLFRVHAIEPVREALAVAQAVRSS